MITLEDRLHDTGEDLRRSAHRVPDRGMPVYRRAVPLRARWAISALAVAALVALPIWLGAFDASTEDPSLGGESMSDLEITRGETDVIAFLDDTVITLDEALNLVEEIRQWEGVARVAYVSRELALIEYRVLFADQPSMVSNVESDPSILPASIRLVLTDGTDAEAIGARLQGIPGVLRVAVNDGNDDDSNPEPGSTTTQPGDFRIHALAAIRQGGAERGFELEEHSFRDDPETVWVTLRAAEGSVEIGVQRTPFTPISDVIRFSPSLEPGTPEVWPDVGEALLRGTGYPSGPEYLRTLTLHSYDGLVVIIHARVPADGEPVAQDAEAPLTFDEMRSWARELLTLLGDGQLDDTSLDGLLRWIGTTELVGWVTGPELVPDHASLLATTEQDDFGRLTLYAYQADIHGTGDLSYCVGAIGDPARAQVFDEKPLVLGAGTTCSQEAEILKFGLLMGSACVPRVESMFTFYGLDETVSTVDIALTDGSTTRLTPVNGAVLFAWAGSHGLASMTLNDGASPEMVSRVQAELSIYGLAEEPCRANRGDG